MSKRFLVSVATAALIIGTSAVSAQSPGGSPGSAGSSSGAAAPSAAGSSNQPSSQGAESGRGSAEGGMKSTQSNEKMAPGAQPNQRAQDSTPGQKSGMSADKGDKAGKDMKAEGAKDAKDGNRNAADNNRSSTTTGQAGAGAKLSGEQRTKITTVIKQQRIQPVTNVNFAISVGTRVPREVHFHPLPTEIISVYPDWRGYEFFLVRDQIVVVDPRSFEIVAVLDA
ncbi:hypothetical protein HNR60_000608 [Rhodopseudomonas rhenobacensis]|uniref:DUF1236 domain-containing protein n=1 Tax=Rhodopseudomonas rhenobacensis TaxID=87461 RepID=A0A7W8DXG9_9BRAD|nr:DUF1236 domain-containing protein [Rhodopseudomonas rhenobacensis]MBB5045873.1 hypothetical protein [Rhodopseudomonas rhenobacensis]